MPAILSGRTTGLSTWFRDARRSSLLNQRDGDRWLRRARNEPVSKPPGRVLTRGAQRLRRSHVVHRVHGVAVEQDGEVEVARGGPSRRAGVPDGLSAADVLAGVGGVGGQVVVDEGHVLAVDATDVEVEPVAVDVGPDLRDDRARLARPLRRTARGVEVGAVVKAPVAVDRVPPPAVRRGDVAGDRSLKEAARAAGEATVLTARPLDDQLADPLLLLPGDRQLA